MGRARSAQAALEAEKKRLKVRSEKLLKVTDALAVRIEKLQDERAAVMAERNDVDNQILKRNQALALFEVIDFDDDDPRP